MSREQEINAYYEKIAKSLDISETMREKAKKSYEAVGEWLGGCDNENLVRIMPQGSFNLGTVIRPLHDNDDGYDIDLVCLLDDGFKLDLCELKSIVGDRLKENEFYRKRLKSPEGKRCWTLEYSGFHMDVLPSAPYAGAYIEPSSTQIRLTHKVSEGCYIPKYSNPYAYKLWFDKRMEVQQRQVIAQYSARNKVEISKVPTNKIKTPLQQAVQLLKRHRDRLFEQDDTNAPISIIITTLAAHAYNNEDTIFGALQSILTNMHIYIENRNGILWVANPVMPQENFADKWQEQPFKKVAFDKWLAAAKIDLLELPAKSIGLLELSEPMKRSFGEKMVNMAMREIAIETRVARDSGSLYMAGLTGGLTLQKDTDTKKVGGHTFFGQ